MAVCATDFGNYTVQIQDTWFFVSFFNRDWHEDHENLGDSVICDRLLLTFYFVSKPTVHRFTKFVCDLINFGNKWQAKTLKWWVLVMQTNLKITMSELKTNN